MPCRNSNSVGVPASRQLRKAFLLALVLAVTGLLFFPLHFDRNIQARAKLLENCVIVKAVVGKLLFLKNVP